MYGFSASIPLVLFACTSTGCGCGIPCVFFCVGVLIGVVVVVVAHILAYRTNIINARVTERTTRFWGECWFAEAIAQPNERSSAPAETIAAAYIGIDREIVVISRRLGTKSYRAYVVSMQVHNPSVRLKLEQSIARLLPLYI